MVLQASRTASHPQAEFWNTACGSLQAVILVDRAFFRTVGAVTVILLWNLEWTILRREWRPRVNGRDITRRRVSREGGLQQSSSITRKLGTA